MPTQYVKCVFKPGDRREYTYHNNGEPLKIGDVVRVEDPRGGWKRITVSGIAGAAPSFPTKEAKLYVPTPEELAAAEAARKEAEGPGFDD